MISLQDQVNAILSAPIPFLVVCGAAVAVAWGAMQWLYKARIEKTKHLFEPARSEIEVKTNISARIEGELKKEVDRLKLELETSPEIPSLTQKLSSIQLKIGELAQANNAVSVAVSCSTPWTQGIDLSLLNELVARNVARKDEF
jgi:hypothetical protein